MAETRTTVEERAPVTGEQNSNLLDALPGAVLILDRDGRVRHASTGTESVLGYRRADLTGRDLFREILPGLERDGAGGRYRSGMLDGDLAMTLQTRDESSAAPRELSLAIRSFEDSGRLWAVALVDDGAALATEVGRRRRAERLAAVGELAAGAAHEINNPLASIKGFAQLLARDTLDRGQQQALEIISQECTRVARIVDNLLDFATQQRVVEREAVDLSKLAEDVVALKRYSLETSGIELDLDLDGGLSAVEAEKGALQRMLLILLNHSERSLARRESARRLQVRTRESNDGVVLYVLDNGPGIPRHLLASSFEADVDDEGGLGLSSAELVARDHGGMLWVESGEGKGTTFTVRLPRSRVRRTEVETAPPATESAPAPSPVRVLVADDEPTLRLALSMFLGRHGYEVEQAEDADRAFELATTGRFDVALVDIRMPGDGLVLLDRLDASPEWHGTAILMTGDHTHSRVRDEIRRGRPHLTKPFDMMDAVRLVASVGNSRAAGDWEESESWTSL